MNIGENIKKHRKEKGLTQEKLAKMVDVSKMTIIRYEKGERKIPFNTLEKIADALDISWAEIAIDSVEPGGAIQITDKGVEKIENDIAGFVGYVESLGGSIEFRNNDSILVSNGKETIICNVNEFFDLKDRVSDFFKFEFTQLIKKKNVE